MDHCSLWAVAGGGGREGRPAGGGGGGGAAGGHVPVAGQRETCPFFSSAMCHHPDSRRSASFASHSRF
jgi:hypothetical protein